jgi:peptidylprolyl isomerase
MEFIAMKSVIPVLVLAAAASLAAAQTAPAAKPATSVKPATAAKSAPAAAKPLPVWVKPPKGVPPVRGVVTVAFSLRYEDIKLGTGAEAESGKLGKILYTGWRSADGVKFDSSEEHRAPVLDKDGKPENDANGQPKLGDPQPLAFPIGMGRMIPGVDQGVFGMKVGGRRRLFIPYQLAYGTRDMPARGDHPGIPPKSDLIFDIELVDVTDMPARPMGMSPMQRPGSTPGKQAPGAVFGKPVATPDPGQPAAPAAAPAPATPPTPGQSAMPPAAAPAPAPPVPATAPQPK